MSAPRDASAASARDLLANPRVLVDTVLPTGLFAVLAVRGDLAVAAGGALAVSAAVLVWRLARRQGLVHAASGVAGIGMGVGVALLSGQAEGFFLPGILGNLAFGVLCAVSVLARRPALAYTSAALYRWPIGWYWHPRVRPAYSEVTWLWAAYYLGKGLWQGHLAQTGQLGLLATVRIATGWPALIALIGITYAYVSWRLARLGGPDVEEWQAQPDG